MKKIKKFFWRFFPLVVCCCIIFSFATYASAASYTGIDWQDYITEIFYDKDEKVITTFYGWGMNYVECKQNNSIVKKQSGTYDFVVSYSSLSKTLHDFEPEIYGYDIDMPLTVVCMPLGTQYAMKLDNIPQGTNLVFDMRMEFYRGGGSYDYELQFLWYDKNMSLISTSIMDSGSRGQEQENSSYTVYFDVPIALNKPANAEYFRPRILFDFNWLYSYNQPTFSIYPQSMRLIFKESALRELSEQNEVIIDRLGDMINGTPSQNQQVQNDVNKLEDSSDKLNDLTDQMVVPKPSIGAEDVAVENLADPTDISLVNQPLTILWENPTILGMVTIIFTLILVSWVFFGKK